MVETIHYIDSSGVTLWSEPMHYSRLFAVDDTIAQNNIFYAVTAVRVEGAIQLVTVVPEPEVAA